MNYYVKGISKIEEIRKVNVVSERGRGGVGGRIKV